MVTRKPAAKKAAPRARRTGPAALPPKTARRRAALSEESPYFARLAADKKLPFVESGCKLLDCVLGGGYVLGRVVNIVGDRSSGKTLLAIEASANFKRQYPKGVIRYLEAEAAFDEEYAQALGMPTSAVSFATDIDTIEGWFADLNKTMDALPEGVPCLYVVDSLDSLSDTKEMARKDDEDSFGAAKAKKISEGFRKIIRRIEEKQVLLVVISQLRDNIGAMYGAKTKRSGGRALDFYASHILWLAEIGKSKKTINGVERVVGINVKATCKKNKVGMAYRECAFTLVFGYGIDDVSANVEWLLTVAGGAAVLETLRLTAKGYKAALSRLRDQGAEAMAPVREQLNNAVVQAWRDVEVEFLPKAGKYG
jgi:protein RecA